MADVVTPWPSFRLSQVLEEAVFFEWARCERLCLIQLAHIASRRIVGVRHSILDQLPAAVAAAVESLSNYSATSSLWCWYSGCLMCADWVRRGYASSACLETMRCYAMLGICGQAHIGQRYRMKMSRIDVGSGSYRVLFVKS
jgi:hypothetical protein